MTYDISVNGTKLEDTDPPIKKTVNFDSHVTPFNYMERAYKPIIITEDGKYVIVVKINYTNSVNGKTVSYWTEQPVVMEDGEEVFLDIVYKGMSDFKIKEIDSKKGNKKLMDKKLYRLPESTI